ncbi:MurR/RpiR family transcriptional regulator [Staphylococcus lugdunensis]|nr:MULTISPECIES: MurR/RpiR family transcriptional regulator [Staphylococcus]AMG61884.1 RpiR family transcriptional regulator [Staphylococcus lugdunensis]AMG64188.1 MurR/RpiR family transcriptional regulator [Staphylococcus lugdunensis]ARB78969.1 MurR/RpiR family transcriptional regulator [Staphylococcus lugdunensis]ARJ08163.1 MurR/RpiR family transcriptional regulator [Staphylococcus lugdunensis]ARJ10398.1 MurR/RpiR family transcriptional regulator [Staphylococcus lugdunensis]
MKFDNRVQRSRHILTKMDRKIVTFIQEQELDDRFSTINSLAYAIGTSPATITRFSNKLGYDNFQDMKFSVQHEKSEKIVENAPLVQQIHRYHQRIIQQTGEFISEEKIKRFAHNLKTRRQINYAGLGSSGLTASEFYYRTMRMGLKGMVSTDAHQMKISASLLSAQDMFVAISNSGETIELIEAAAIAHDQGAYVAVITNYEGSSITEKADLVLITTDQSRINDSQFINTQIATFFLMDIVSYLLLNDPHMNQLYQHTRQTILGK